MDIAQLRNSLVKAIEAARHEAAARRTRSDEAARQYQTFLDLTAVPVFRAMASALKGEGLLFDVMTPSGGVRLVPERAREDGIEIALDTSADPPQALVTVQRGRGSRSLRHERPVAGATPLAALSDQDVAAMLLEELRPWLER
jgi:hypothetical protein